MISSANGSDFDADGVRSFLESCLNSTILNLRRRPSPYRTSFPIEELDVESADGNCYQMMMKNLDWNALTEEGRRAKPDFLHNPQREIELYQSMLMPTRIGSPHCYGAFVDPSAGVYWLFLERISGRELYQIGELDIWRRVAEWLAGFHALSYSSLNLRKQLAHLISYDEHFYRVWLQRSLSWAHSQNEALRWLTSRYDAVIERLLAMPTVVLHGEFYASNVLLAETTNGLGVYPVDWEMAACGPGLIDLAAITAGKWSDHERTILSLAYRDAWSAQGLPTPSREEFLTSLDYCRLHLAIQWLGWSPDWQPPADYRQNWLEEALSLARKLRL